MITYIENEKLREAIAEIVSAEVDEILEDELGLFLHISTDIEEGINMSLEFSGKEGVIDRKSCLRTELIDLVDYIAEESEEGDITKLLQYKKLLDEIYTDVNKALGEYIETVEEVIFDDNK